MSSLEGFKLPSLSAKNPAPISSFLLPTDNTFEALRVAESISAPSSPSPPSAPTLAIIILVLRRRRRRKNKGGPNPAPTISIQTDSGTATPDTSTAGPTANRNSLALINGPFPVGKISTVISPHLSVFLSPAPSLPLERKSSQFMEDGGHGPAVPSPSVGLPPDVARADPHQPPRT
jgi:hypothetical protein